MLKALHALAFVLIVLSTGGFSRSSAASFSVQPARFASSTVLISEFRARGPGGGNDEFIELYNKSVNPIDIGLWRVRFASGGIAPTFRDIAIIPSGTSIPAHGHYLITGSAYSGTVTGDQSSTSGLNDSGGIALFLPDQTTIVDQAGYYFDATTQASPSPYGEGQYAFASFNNTQNNIDQCLERKPGGTAGSGNDIDDNASDFSFHAICGPQNRTSAPTPSSNIAIGGSVKRPSSRGITGAKITITCPSQPNPVIIFTGRRGTYLSPPIFEGFETCTVSVSQKRFTFSPNTRSIVLPAAGATAADFTSNQ